MHTNNAIEEETALTGQGKIIAQQDNTPQQPIYSSLAPKYEQVELSQGNYDVVNRIRARPNTQTIESHYPTTDKDYATLSYNKQEHNYHVLEMTKEPNGETSQDYPSQQNQGNQEGTKQRDMSENGELTRIQDPQ